jgi:hypothetical protein
MVVFDGRRLSFSVECHVVVVDPKTTTSFDYEYLAAVLSSASHPSSLCGR